MSLRFSYSQPYRYLLRRRHVILRYTADYAAAGYALYSYAAFVAAVDYLPLRCLQAFSAIAACRHFLFTALPYEPVCRFHFHAAIKDI